MNFNLNRMIGPFVLKDLLLITGVCITAIATMFLLKGALKMPIIIELWIVIAVSVVCICIILLLAKTISGYWKWGQEGFIFATARTQGLFVRLEVELGSLAGEIILGEKERPKDPVLADTESGVKVDPSMLSKDAEPIHLPLGLDVYTNSTFNFMPQSLRNHAGFREIVQFREELASKKIKNDAGKMEDNEDPLGFLPIKEYCELLSCHEHNLDHDAMMKLNKYYKVGQARDKDGSLRFDNENKPILRHFRRYESDGKFYEIELELPDMLKAIAEQKAELAKRPIIGCPLTLTEAFVNNSIAASSQLVQQIRMIDRQKFMLDKANQIDWAKYMPIIWTIGIIGIIVLALIFTMGPDAVCKVKGA